MGIDDVIMPILQLRDDGGRLEVTQRGYRNGVWMQPSPLSWYWNWNQYNKYQKLRLNQRVIMEEERYTLVGGKYH